MNDAGEPNTRWGEPAEHDTLRAFLLKPSRTLLHAGKVNPFISVTSAVLTSYWSATELSTYTHMQNTSEPNPVEICMPSGLDKKGPSGLDTKAQNFSGSLNQMTDMKISVTSICWSTRIAESRTGNFLLF